ncbi:MAG: patatin family protein [Epulopiscium sp. Nele67-Bin004]|nr:MAG: patatin family protein [Epulopiscium sp. Nele67-Bin004]
MGGLVLEGGSFRCMFSAGVMDALLENKIICDYIIGVSAGISSATSYVSKQPRRNLDVIKEYRLDPRYISRRNLISTGSMVGIDFIFDEIPNKLNIFDWKNYYKFKGKIKVGVTDMRTGESVYKDGKHLDKTFNLLRASCAVPLFFPPVDIEDRLYLDGGIADAIPIKQALKDGNDKLLVVLTQPQGYLKSKNKLTKAGAYFYKEKYPELYRVMLNRNAMYNKTIKFIEEFKRKYPENIIVLQPEYKINSMESDIGILENVYNHGYNMAKTRLENIGKFLTN